MKQIKVNDSDLIIRKLKLESENPSIPTAVLGRVFSEGREYIIKDGTIELKPGVDEVYIIEKGSYHSEVTYEVDECIVMTAILKVLSWDNHECIEVAEKLVSSIGHSRLTYEFYECFGFEGCYQFGSVCREVLGRLHEFRDWTEEESYIDKFESEFLGANPHKQIEGTYSVHQLLWDIKNDGSDVYFGTELMPEYEKISGSDKTKILNAKSMCKDDWYKFKDLVGNRSVANISISFLDPVTVEIPKCDNPEEMEKIESNILRIRNVINKGKLHLPRLVIRVKNDEFLKKLNNIPDLVVNDLLDPKEIVLDLETIPVVSEDYKKEYVNLEDLVRLEHERIKYYVRSGYVKSKLNEEKDHYKKHGIYGNLYIPEDIYVKKIDTDNSSDLVYELKQTVKKLPFRTSKFPENLKDEPELDKLLKGVDISMEGLMKEREHLNNYTDQLRSLIFKVISCRGLVFDKSTDKIKFIDTISPVRLGFGSSGTIQWHVSKGLKLKKL